MKTSTTQVVQKSLYILLLIVLICMLYSMNLFAQNPGELDTNFGDNGIYIGDYSSVSIGRSVAKTDDGKLIVAGTLGFAGSTANGVVIRLNSGGTLDTSFGDQGMVTTDISGAQEFYDVKVLNDGSIIAAGVSTSQATDDDILLVKYTSDGTIDSSFGDQGKILFHYDVREGIERGGIQILDDGKILILGTSFSAKSASSVFLLIKLDSNGTFDNGFGEQGILEIKFDGYDYNNAYQFVITDDNKVLIYASRTISGTHPNPDIIENLIVKITMDGVFDTSFGEQGVVELDLLSGELNDIINDICVQKDGKILLLGQTDAGSFDFDLALRRYNEDGSIDNSFGNNGLITETLGNATGGEAIALQSDNKILVATGSHDLLDAAIIRYNSDGSIDKSFGDNGYLIHSSFGAYLRSLFFTKSGEIFFTDTDARVSSSYKDLIVAKVISGLETISSDGIHEEKFSQIKLYPNPVQSTITIDFSQHINSKSFDARIYDVNGNMVMRKTLAKNQNKINVTHLQNGIYFLHSEYGVKRFIKH